LEFPNLGGRNFVIRRRETQFEASPRPTCPRATSMTIDLCALRRLVRRGLSRSRASMEPPTAESQDRMRDSIQIARGSFISTANTARATASGSPPPQLMTTMREFRPASGPDVWSMMLADQTRRREPERGEPKAAQSERMPDVLYDHSTQYRFRKRVGAGRRLALPTRLPINAGLSIAFSAQASGELYEPSRRR